MSAATPRGTQPYYFVPAPSRHPAMTALWNAGGFDDEGQTAFDYGLALLLDGMETDGAERAGGAERSVE